MGQSSFDWNNAAFHRLQSEGCSLACEPARGLTRHIFDQLLYQPVTLSCSHGLRPEQLPPVLPDVFVPLQASRLSSDR